MKFLGKILPVVGLLALAVTVRAQTAPPAPSLDQMKAQSAAIRTELQAQNRHVLHLQAVTRKDKDVIKLTCVNDKLIQIKAQMDLADNAATDVEANTPTSAESFAEMQKIAEAVKKLTSEADACAGALDMYKQESKLDVERPEVPDDPTQDDPFTPDTMFPDVDVPGFATPYR
jgi:hypothetical protein